MTLYILVIHDTDWVWDGEASVCVDTDSVGGVFESQELATRAGKENKLARSFDVIETILNKVI